MTQSRGMATPARIIGRQKRLGFTPGSWCRLRETLRGMIGVARRGGSNKNTESYPEFFHDMRQREAAEPLLVVCDGAPGMIRAID